MSRLGIEAGLAGQSTGSARLLETATSFAERTQAALEGLGTASNLLALTGLGAGVVATFLSSLMVEKQEQGSR